VRTDFLSVQVLPKTCALRAPTAVSVRIKTIRTETAVTVKTKDGVGFHTRSSIACGWVHHPRAIDDPRGQVLVRAGFAN
jgi:hypothetical protein